METEATETCISRPSNRQQVIVADTASSEASTETSVTSTTGPGQAQAQPHHPTSTAASSSSVQPPSARHVAEARAAVVASIGNMMDRELQGRAAILHDNAAAIAQQERNVARATEALGRENDKLARVAADTARKVKELGNVQNWAEMLERDFMVLEETLRLVREGSGSECSWSDITSHGPSQPGSREGSVSADGEREQPGPSGAVDLVANVPKDSETGHPVPVRQNGLGYARRHGYHE